MKWEEVRAHFPHQWLLIEATRARTENGLHIVDDVAVVDTFPTGEATWKAYADRHRAEPWREFIPLHTDREHLEFEEQFSLGLRMR